MTPGRLSPLASLLAAAPWLAAPLACQPPAPAAPAPAASSAPAPTATAQAPAAEDPCARAARGRARVASLLGEGRLDRALRVIAWADALCPASAAESATARSAAQAELQAGAEGVDEAIAGALAARTKGDAAASQRLLDRAAARVEREAGVRLALEVQNGFEASNGLPWRSNGGVFPRSLGVIVPSSVLSHDGKLLAIPDGRRVLLADVKARRLSLVLEGHEANITSLAFSPDDRQLASGGYDGAARVWDTATGASRRELHPADVVRDVRFLRGGAVLGCLHGDASAWDIASGRKVGQAAGGPVNAVSIDPDGAVIMSDNGTVRSRFGVFTGQAVPGPVPRDITLSRDESLGAALFADRVGLVRYPGGKAMRSLRSRGTPSRAWFSPRGERVAVGEARAEYEPISRIFAWDVRTGKELGKIDVGPDEAYSVEVVDISREQIVVASGGQRRTIELASGKVVATGPVEGPTLRSFRGLGGEDALTPDAFALSDDGATAAVMLHEEVGEEWPSRLVLLDLQKRTLRDLDGARPVNELHFLPGGRLMSWHYSDIASWDLSSGKVSVTEHGGDISGFIHVSPDGRLAVGQKGREPLVLDPSTGERLKVELPASMEFMGAGASGLLAFASPERAISLLDPGPGKLRRLADPAPSGPGTAWGSVALSRDGRWALLVERVDSTHFSLWSASTGGGAPRSLSRPLASVELIAAVGDRGILARLREHGEQAREEVQIVDASDGSVLGRIESDLWELGVVAEHRRGLLSATSRPEALVGLWSPGSQAPAAALRVLARKKSAYVLTPGGQVEIFGDADVLGDSGFCRAGARIFPVELCQERALTRGILRGLATGDASWRDP